MTIDEIVKCVDRAIEALAPMRSGMEGDTSLETTLALGTALGALLKAKHFLNKDLGQPTPSANERETS